jgi:hypothetical protein
VSAHAAPRISRDGVGVRALETLRAASGGSGMALEEVVRLRSLGSILVLRPG